MTVAMCRVCCRHVTVLDDGTLRWHLPRPGDPTRDDRLGCPGSDTGRLCARCVLTAVDPPAIYCGPCAQIRTAHPLVQISTGSSALTVTQPDVTR